MEIEKLKKEDFIYCRGDPYIQFSRNGKIILSRNAVKHLKLLDHKNHKLTGISICFTKDERTQSEFSVMKDADGWGLHLVKSTGIASFNCKALAEHIIDKTWDSCVSHPVGAVKPFSLWFWIALLPIDDDKNKNVFALIRKKV